MIDVLARPIIDLLGTFGSGALPSGSPADAMRAASAAIDAVHALGRTGISDLGGVWTGVAADAAIGKAEATQASSVQLSDRGREIAAVVDAASECVRAGTAELQGILQSFLSIATNALPVLATPAGQAMLISAAIEHLGRALAVVARVRSELAGHTASMVTLTAPDSVHTEARTVAASVSAPASGTPTTAAAAIPAPGAAQSDAVSRFASSFAGSYIPTTSAFRSATARTTPYGLGARSSVDTGSGAGSSSYDPRFGGSGVEVLLPDGSTAVAPNKEAADAVRYALTQQGVPYQWGGTSPGQGLDCSGLTQWAYGEAGVDLPRLAQEQTVGTPVDPENLMPGDLAVWDGHVAMVIGNGQMVEAGDPVSVSSIRTTNIGMAFYGFYRPTE
ncbi:NlpC/P60 family protein [Rhodococcus sp. ABRD24]|uniref:C40 family peptidase n=1 Tax=Rhodococcus sp. ABRD24 TaxID=2507582 RepID=UPI00103F14EC|nr:C40 family peptidase [Rhodococcus sp. ABRD24]QBJ95411.1 NlpC/P60 family protein [Rhodococcus sp. ABRD24]